MIKGASQLAHEHQLRRAEPIRVRAPDHACEPNTESTKPMGRAKSMEMRKIASTNIAEVGYDENTKQMKVHFVRGGRYLLYDIEPEIFEQFLKAESPGSFYNRNIRGYYKFDRVDEEQE